MGDGLLAALVAAETDVWRALQTGDAAADEAALHPSFLGVYTDGPADRAAHTGQLANGPTIAEFAIDRAQAMPLAPALALLTYRARFTRMGGDAAEEMWVSSLWRAEADGWVNLFSQDTPAR
nr:MULTISPECIES: nuclear transport factor 2 family protein [unclassified Jannaschia]